MTIFQLLLFSCVRSLSHDGDVMTMSCNWDNGGGFYRSQEDCEARGAAKIGSPILSFMAISRKVEKIKCVEVHVE